jgi:hypothetical protein
MNSPQMCKTTNKITLKYELLVLAKGDLVKSPVDVLSSSSNRTI